jgi:hypothetical protein
MKLRISLYFVARPVKTNALCSASVNTLSAASAASAAPIH